jgi:hypothetical protein
MTREELDSFFKEVKGKKIRKDTWTEGAYFISDALESAGLFLGSYLMRGLYYSPKCGCRKKVFTVDNGFNESGFSKGKYEYYIEDNCKKDEAGYIIYDPIHKIFLSDEVEDNAIFYESEIEDAIRAYCKHEEVTFKIFKEVGIAKNVVTSKVELEL